MKPLIFIPPAQAEALSDTQDDLRLDDLRAGDFGLRQPWRDDENFNENTNDAAEEFSCERSARPRQEPLKPPLSKTSPSNAQLWPSSINSSR